VRHWRARKTVKSAGPGTLIVFPATGLDSLGRTRVDGGGTVSSSPQPLSVRSE
jgi:hypothetical protein